MKRNTYYISGPLKTLMEEKGINATTLANETNTSKGAVSGYLSGDNKASIKKIEQFAKYFGKDVQYFTEYKKRMKETLFENLQESLQYLHMTETSYIDDQVHRIIGSLKDDNNNGRTRLDVYKINQNKLYDLIQDAVRNDAEGISAYNQSFVYHENEYIRYYAQSALEYMSEIINNNDDKISIEQLYEIYEPIANTIYEAGNKLIDLLKNEEK